MWAKDQTGVPGVRSWVLPICRHTQGVLSSKRLHQRLFRSRNAIVVSDLDHGNAVVSLSLFLQRVVVAAVCDDKWVSSSAVAGVATEIRDCVLVVMWSYGCFRLRTVRRRSALVVGVACFLRCCVSLQLL